MSEIKKVPTRDEVELKDTWATEDLFVSDEAWEEDLKRTEEFVRRFSEMRGTLGQSGKNVLALFRLDEECDLWIDNVANYAMRKADQDTTNGHYQDFSARLRNASVQIGNASAYVSPEILAIPEETLEGFFKEVPELELYRVAINDITRKRAHVLSPEMESLLAASGNVTGAASNIRGMLDNADIKFPSIIDENGQERQITHGSFIPLMEGKCRETRKKAFESVYHTYEQFKNTYASLLAAQTKQLKFKADARHYNSTIEASLDATNVPVSVYHNLIEAVHNHMDKMYKYVALRKKVMGYDELHFYDIYAPITESSTERIPYEVAQQTVLEAVKPLGEEYVEILRNGFNSRWVDVYENVGKRSGAYSAGAKVHPYVLMNYSGTLDSEFTLAHEMGHAMHSYFSNRTQPTIYSNYRIFVAEIASTCNEALLMQYLLGKCTDKKERAILINHFLDSFKGTVYRQTMFAEFELMMNQMNERGETLTADKLCKVYEDLQRLYFGEDIVIDKEIAYEWCRIPHFYYNYYVFQYATGFSAAIALSRKILQEGEPAVKKYLQFLSGGCSKDPISLLKDAGVDMTTAAPINEALAYFGELVDEMEELLK